MVVLTAVIRVANPNTVGLLSWIYISFLVRNNKNIWIYDKVSHY